MGEHVDLTSVSVVITAYNASQWIRGTIDSILAQTYSVLEVIVVDDGSTDNTAEIVKAYGKNVKYIYQDNFGQPVARNCGIRMSKGDFIAFVDADDYWHPRKLEMQMEMIRSQHQAWVVSDSEWVDVNEEKMELTALPLQDGDVLRALLMGNFITSATPVVRRDVFEQVGYFNEDPKARIGEDWDMWLRIAARYQLGVVHEKLACIRVHASSMLSITSMSEKVQSLEGVVMRAVRREPDRLKPLEHDALANIWYRAGVQLMKQNNYRQARTYFFREIRYRPLKMESWIYLLMSVAGTDISTRLINVKRLLWKHLDNFEKK